MQDQTNETSMHWPYPAQFLQLQATSDLIFSSSSWRQIQESFGNYVPKNTLRVQDTNEYKPYAKSKLHIDVNDKPPATLNGKFLYGTIPFFPFQLVSPHFKNALHLPRKIILPPLTNLRIAFRKQANFDQVARMEHSAVSVDKITSNQTVANGYGTHGASGNEWTPEKIKTEILSMKMCVEKILVEPKFNPYQELKVHTYTYSSVSYTHLTLPTKA